MSEPTVLVKGLGIPESPRWHEGRLWFCNWIDRQIVAVDLDGRAEVAPARDQEQLMGYSIDWLPDGRLLMTGDRLRRQEPDGSMVTLAEQKANEIAVDARGNIYLNGADFNFAGGEAPKPGYIKLLTPDGNLRQVADDIQFPNGMVIASDNRTLIISESFAGQLTAFDIDADGGLSNRRVFAEGLGPDGICADAEGAVWVSAGGSSVVRVAEGGEILQRVELRENRAPFAVMLGGPDRRTLFIMTAEWRAADGIAANLERLTSGPRTGEILTVPVSVPGAGWPSSRGPTGGPGRRPRPDHVTIHTNCMQFHRPASLAERAVAHMAVYCVVNDVTARATTGARWSRPRFDIMVSEHAWAGSRLRRRSGDSNTASRLAHGRGRTVPGGRGRLCPARPRVPAVLLDADRHGRLPGWRHRCANQGRCSTRWSSGRRSCRSPTRRSPRSCSLRGAVCRSRPGR